MRRSGILFLVLTAGILWTLMFSPWTAPHLPFWVMMPLSGVTLAGLATYLDKGWIRECHINVSEILLAVAIATVLWGIFYVGDKVSTALWGFTREQIEDIYGMQGEVSTPVLSLLLLLVIGPAEEIFWRGSIQRSLSKHLGANAGFVLTTLLYALVHVSSGNFMLIMAALTAGIVWGGLYRLFPHRLSALILSHALWDAAVFVWFPIR